MKYKLTMTEHSRDTYPLSKEMQTLFGISDAQAQRIISSTPVLLLDNVSREEGENIKLRLEYYGARIKIEADPQLYVPREVFSDSGNSQASAERESLLSLYKMYLEEEKAINEIAEKKFLVNRLNGNIAKIEKDIKNYTRINNSGANVKIAKFNPKFSIAKPIFIVFAILSTFISGFIYNKYDVSILKSYMILIVISGVVSAAVPLIKELKRYNADKKHEKKYSENAKLRAAEYMNNIDTHKKELTELKNKTACLEKEIAEAEADRINRPGVSVTIAMPEELKSLEGVSLLLQYIDNGRAVSVQEAINLYYREINDNALREEAYKQTEYAKQQAENAKIAAQNSQKAVELSEKALNASQRAADAAEESADYERRSYWNDIYYQNSKK